MLIRSLAVLAIFVFVIAASAQDRSCALKLADLPDAPELFGFRLGMSTEQVKARVPQITFQRPNEFGASKTSFSPDFDPRIDKASLPGVRTISLDFVDGRVTSLWLGYDGTFKWHTVPDFVKGISQALRLPATWEPWKVRGQQLRCADFQMTLSIVAEGPSFRIVDETAAQTLAARVAARQEAASESTEESEAAEILADKKAMIYYLDTCRPTVEIEEAHRIVFKTREEAEKAGYKPACK
jgi:hypothetical protein